MEEKNGDVFLSGGLEAALFKFSAYAPAALERLISRIPF
jgi:hypothetical protein